MENASPLEEILRSQLHQKDGNKKTRYINCSAMVLGKGAPAAPPPVPIVRRRIIPLMQNYSFMSVSSGAPTQSSSTLSSTLSSVSSASDDLTLEPQVDPFLDTTVRGYYFESIISWGGSAIVYRVVKDDKLFVAKVSLDNDLDQEFLQKAFVTEYELLKSVNHKHIIRAYDLFEHDCRQIMILEYFPGCNLQDFIARNSMITRKRNMKVISKQILKGLKYLHKNDIVHRDIKPANILIGRNNKVKIIDFGGALKLDPSQMVEDRRPTFITSDFTPPEVLIQDVRSACDVWIKAFDMWSVGVTLYESLTGHLPYTAESGIFIKRESFFVEPDYDIFKRLDVKLMSLVRKCLDVQPSTRIRAKEALKTRYFSRFF